MIQFNLKRLSRLRNLTKSLFGLLTLLFTAGLIASCSTVGKLTVSHVTYQSINTKNPKDITNSSAFENATILATYFIDENGYISIFIKNLTSEILVIDQEKSFFINSDGISQSYFDPNVYTTSTTKFSYNTTTNTVNLGALASAFGINGMLGTLIGGFSTGFSYTTGSATTNSVAKYDSRLVQIGPKGNICLSKYYQIKGVGKRAIENFTPNNASESKINYDSSPIRFSVCISYRLGENETTKKMITDFYIDSRISKPVVRKGNIQLVNDAFRELIVEKPDLFGEPWYLISIHHNLSLKSYEEVPFSLQRSSIYDKVISGALFDYQ